MEENNLVCGFADDSLVILTKATIDIFLKQENPGDLIALYSFYYYTSKWQHTNQPKCTTEYVAKGLHWNRSKVAKVKKQLMEFGLIEDVRMIDEQTKKVTGYYIKMSYVFKKTTLKKSQCTQNPPTGNENSKASVLENEGVDFEDTNALSTNNLNALSTNNKELDISNDISNEKNFKNDNEVEEIEEEKPQKANKRNTFIPPTLDEVTEYCKERGNNIDPEEFIAHYTCRDWYIGKTNRRMKDWKSAVVVWEKNELRYKQDYKPQYGKQNKEPTGMDALKELADEWGVQLP